jgi:hypothetical protein
MVTPIQPLVIIMVSHIGCLWHNFGSCFPRSCAKGSPETASMANPVPASRDSRYLERFGRGEAAKGQLSPLCPAIAKPAPVGPARRRRSAVARGTGGARGSARGRGGARRWRAAVEGHRGSRGRLPGGRGGRKAGRRGEPAEAAQTGRRKGKNNRKKEKRKIEKEIEKKK